MTYGLNESGLVDELKRQLGITPDHVDSHQQQADPRIVAAFEAHQAEQTRQAEAQRARQAEAVQAQSDAEAAQRHAQRTAAQHPHVVSANRRASLKTSIMAALAGNPEGTN